MDKQIYKEGEPTWGCKSGVLDVEDVKAYIKMLYESLIQDWEFCKKANVEPHIHPRRVIELIHRHAGDKLIDAIVEPHEDNSSEEKTEKTDLRVSSSDVNREEGETDEQIAKNIVGNALMMAKKKNEPYTNHTLFAQEKDLKLEEEISQCKHCHCMTKTIHSKCGKCGGWKIKGGTTIKNVKVVGICSKCRKEGDEIPKYKDGSIIPDKDISCLNKAFDKCYSREDSEHPFEKEIKKDNERLNEIYNKIEEGEK